MCLWRAGAAWVHLAQQAHWGRRCWGSARGVWLRRASAAHPGFIRLLTVGHPGKNKVYTDCVCALQEPLFVSVLNCTPHTLPQHNLLDGGLSCIPHLSRFLYPPSPAPQVSVHVCIFVFDLMYLDGRTLLALPLEERRRLLLTALPGMREGHIQLAQGTVLYPLALRPAPPQAATSVPQAAVQPATVPLSAAGEGAGRGRFTGAGEGGVGEGAESEELGGKGEDQGGGVASEGGGREGVDTEHAEGLVEASITATQAGASATAAAGAPPADETEAGAAGTGDDGGSGVVAELGAQVMDLLLQSFNDGAEGERCLQLWSAASGCSLQSGAALGPTLMTHLAPTSAPPHSAAYPDVCPDACRAPPPCRPDAQEPEGSL